MRLTEAERFVTRTREVACKLEVTQFLELKLADKTALHVIRVCGIMVCDARRGRGVVTHHRRVEHVDASVEGPPLENLDISNEFQTVVVADAEVLRHAYRHLADNLGEIAYHIGAVTVVSCEVEIAALPEFQVRELVTVSIYWLQRRITHSEVTVIVK